MFKMEELALRYAPVDQGSLRLSISVLPEMLANDYVLTCSMPYSESIEYGTRPFWAPIDPLKAWALRKIGDENVGYAIQAKIAKVGIKAHPFMRPAFRQVLDFWYDFYLREEFSK
jgi:hypothetical protein